MTVLGTIYADTDLAVGPSNTRLLRPTRNPLGPSYQFEVTVQPGPRFNSATNASVKAGATTPGSFARLGLSGHVRHDLVLRNVYKLSMKFDGDQRAPFVVAVEPGLAADHHELIWITEVLCADIQNSDEVDLDVGFNPPKGGTNEKDMLGKGSAKPWQVALAGGSKVDVKGLGVLLGVRGFRVSVSTVGRFPLQALSADVADTKVLHFDGLSNDHPVAVHATRTDNDHVEFALLDSSSAVTYVRRDDGTWERDTVPGRSTHARAEWPDLMLAVTDPTGDSGDTSRRILLIDNPTGASTAVSLSMFRTKEGVQIVGKAMRLLLAPFDGDHVAAGR
jgi:hypothetical protein